MSEKPNNSFIIETHHLHFAYANGQIAVDQVSLQIPKQSIYGFLGPNGAGKTTSIRLLLALLKPQQGEISYFGHQIRNTKQFKEVFANIGSMVETPSVYGHLTASENLRIWQKIYNCPLHRVKDVLEIVGLEESSKKQVRHFSMGMKQRLGIGIALLHQPELLILDEPTNGLDPNGILDIRLLLQKLNQDHGVTILISSHILSEIEKLVTHVGIINQGRLKFQGALTELRQQQKQEIRFGVENIGEALSIMNRLGYHPLKVDNEGILLPEITRSEVSMILHELHKKELNVFQVQWINHNLEQIFLDLIK